MTVGHFYGRRKPPTPPGPDPLCPKCEHPRSRHSSDRRKYCNARWMQKKIRYDGFIREYEDNCICDLTPRDIDLNLELMNTKPPED